MLFSKIEPHGGKDEECDDDAGGSIGDKGDEGGGSVREFLSSQGHGDVASLFKIPECGQHSSGK